MSSVSQAQANKHYRESHPPLQCIICKQLFNNPCSLWRHKYVHLELKFPCQSCSKSFPFESDLVNHCLKHRCHPGHQCNHQTDGKICAKWFFAKSDLNKHTKVHSGIIYSCMECSYITYDVRYLCAHIYTHSDHERYQCSKCGEHFKHHTQLIRHSEKCSI